MISELITVVIPTIPERTDFLEQAVDSIKKQTAGEASIAIGVDEEREGPATVRNRLMESVETPWVLFLDDDDYLHDEYFERVLPHFRSADIVYTWCERINIPVNLDQGFDADALRRANFIPVTACVRVSKFMEAGGFPLGIAYEDWGLWLRMLDHNAEFTCIPEKLWTYRRHDGSRTHENQRAIAAGELSEA